MIYSIEMTARILQAMDALNGANNGYAFLHIGPDVANALRLAGFRSCSGIHPHDGRPCYMVFTPKGWDAYVAELRAQA
jgi:hypothetical protein